MRAALKHSPTGSTCAASLPGPLLLRQAHARPPPPTASRRWPEAVPTNTTRSPALVCLKWVGKVFQPLLPVSWACCDPCPRLCPPVLSVA